MNLGEKALNLPFVEKLCLVTNEGELDYWEEREEPPNLSIDDYRIAVDRIDTVENFKWVDRKSDLGPHGQDGEDQCFKFECEISFGGIFEIEIKRYFVKGYFFEKNNLKGVTIQSFREA